MKRYLASLRLEQKPKPDPKLAPVISLDAERRARRGYDALQPGHSKRV
jgi:hypothetical protein